MFVLRLGIGTALGLLAGFLFLDAAGASTLPGCPDGGGVWIVGVVCVSYVLDNL